MSKQECTAIVNSTTPRLEAKCPPVCEIFVIKRVVATSGDKITYKEINEDGISYGAIFVNGYLVLKKAGLTEVEYRNCLTDKVNNSYYPDGVVPEGYSIVFGDNTATSEDSKSVGLINNKDILGVSIYRIYPFEQMGVPTRK